MFQIISKYNLQLMALLIYVAFVFVKFDSIRLLSENQENTPILLVDWNDDKILEDHEFSAENKADRICQVFEISHTKKFIFEPDFFYYRIYKDIKLSITTPPPKI